jgi:hypothetical protein
MGTVDCTSLHALRARFVLGTQVRMAVQRSRNVFSVAESERKLTNPPVQQLRVANESSAGLDACKLWREKLPECLQWSDQDIGQVDQVRRNSRLYFYAKVQEICMPSLSRMCSNSRALHCLSPEVREGYRRAAQECLDAAECFQSTEDTDSSLAATIDPIWSILSGVRALSTQASLVVLELQDEAHEGLAGLDVPHEAAMLDRLDIKMAFLEAYPQQGPCIRKALDLVTRLHAAIVFEIIRPTP